MIGKDLAYVALVVDDVEAAARIWQRDFGLPRRDCRVGDGARTTPVLGVGATTLALFAPGDPFVDGERRTGVHHLALGLPDPEAGAHFAEHAGVRVQAGRPEPGLNGGRRFLLQPEATGGIRTYLTHPLDAPPPSPGWVERIDHLGVASQDNQAATEVFCRRLGCVLEGTETDTETQISIESFVSDRYGTIVHARPAELVAVLHAAFIRVGDCELELIQELDSRLGARAGQGQAGNTRQDHGAIGRYIVTRGPGLHHVALRVADINGRLAALERAGHQVIDRVGRPGGRRALIGFVHPRSMRGVLVHLVERTEWLGEAAS